MIYWFISSNNCTEFHNRKTNTIQLQTAWARALMGTRGAFLVFGSSGDSRDCVVVVDKRTPTVRGPIYTACTQTHTQGGKKKILLKTHVGKSRNITDGRKSLNFQETKKKSKHRLVFSSWNTQAHASFA